MSRGPASPSIQPRLPIRDAVMRRRLLGGTESVGGRKLEAGADSQRIKFVPSLNYRLFF